MMPLSMIVPLYHLFLVSVARVRSNVGEGFVDCIKFDHFLSSLVWNTVQTVNNSSSHSSNIF